MFFVGLGIVFILLNIADIGPFGAWNWLLSGDLWKFCTPFVLAVLWWMWADWSGLNKRREIERMDKRKADRRKENLTALGIDPKSRKRGRR